MKSGDLPGSGEKLTEEVDGLKKNWKGADQEHLTVTAEDVAEVVSKWTGVPVQNLKRAILNGCSIWKKSCIRE